MKLLIVSVKNELSGSCVSAVNLSNLLLENNIGAEIVSPDGSFMESKNKTLNKLSFNPFEIMENLVLVRSAVKKNEYDFVLLNTIQSFFYLTVIDKNKACIYIHEQQMQPRLFYKLIEWIINTAGIKVLVVNPVQIKYFPNAKILPNFIKIKNNEKVDNKDKVVLMISIPRMKKGVADFFRLAEKRRDYRFVWLTDLGLIDNETKDFIKKVNKPTNLTIEERQTEKESLLREAKYLVSLSHFNETFGLVLLESINSNTIPLSYENDGSSYCLNNMKELFLDKNDLVNSFYNIDRYISERYSDTLEKLKENISIKFSESCALKNINKFLDGACIK